MKKFLTTGVLAVALAALSTQQASAWVNSKFGIGLNWNYQSGGNNLLWGAFRNGQPPAPDCGIGCPGPVGPGCPAGPGMPYHGFVQPGMEQGIPAGQEATSPASAVPTRTQASQRAYYNGQTVNYQYPYQYNANFYNYYYGYGRR